MQISTRLGTDEARYIINQTSRLHGLSNLMLTIKTDIHIRRAGQQLNISRESDFYRPRSRHTC